MGADTNVVLQLGLAAALADGACTPQERAQLESVARSLGVDPSALPASGVVLPPNLGQVFDSPDARRAAYELAVAVCNADGAANDAETRFLADLRGKLGLADASVAAVEREAGALAAAPIGTASDAPKAGATDDLILQQAILAGALELLPQSLATMAIIPLQLRLVYLIGKAQGQQLDAAQGRDLLAALGIGAAAQVVDGVARKLIGGIARGVFGRVLGSVTGGVAAAATGAATSFATTYALGHAAAQYYGQGRTLSTADLQALFQRLVGEAKALYPTVRTKIEEQARTLNLQQLIGSLTAGA